MEKFEVSFLKTDLIGFGLIYFVFVMLCVLMFIVGYNFNLSLIFAIFLFVTSIMMILSTCLFKVSVMDENFKVRTKFGKRYEFNILEIRKIKYTKHNNLKHGPQYTLTIITENKELELNRQMKNFDIMVKYLLNKYDDGKLDNKVMSKYCYKLLNDYKCKQ
ncbi:MAG: hypothetical protein ACI4GV_08060 [Acutalibacteraceae bacterium]